MPGWTSVGNEVRLFAHHQHIEPEFKAIYSFLGTQVTAYGPLRVHLLRVMFSLSSFIFVSCDCINKYFCERLVALGTAILQNSFTKEFAFMVCIYLAWHVLDLAVK